jgi:hypothetical protein
MALFAPLVLAFFGLGSIGFGAYSDMTKKPAPAPQGKQPPPELMAAHATLLSTGRDPDAMDQMAVAFDGYGYTEMARQLRERAAQLRVSKATGQPLPPPPVLTTAPMPNIPAPSPTPAAQATATLTGTGVNMRAAPSTTAAVVASLSKPEVVMVINWTAATSGGYQWAQVRRSNGTAGFVAKNYLALNAPAPAAVSGQELAFAVGAEDSAEPRSARCVAPSGCRLRNAPNPSSGFKVLVANGDRVTVMKQVAGAKAERRSPGPGGWSLVRYGRHAGWLPSEWLLS